MEIMIRDHRQQDENNHLSSLLYSIEDNLSDVYFPNFVEPFMNSVSIHEVDFKNNLLNIKEMIPLDISVKQGIVKNIYIGVSYSPSWVKIYRVVSHEFHDVFVQNYEEILGIDQNIVVHDIKTYPNAKPVQQCLHPVYPKKVFEIKAKVEKLLWVGFIYPIPLTDWVSNIVLVMKKYGTIQVCVDYQDLNHACPNNNYLTLFIDEIVDNCISYEVY